MHLSRKRRGNIQTKSGTLAELNPFRYRSYYYDNETWFYYLQSRYYDPAIGRFINADAFASTGQSIIGHNMFAYCGNNPVCRVDPCGHCFYNAKGEWCHDNWEYLGGYERKPDPGYYQGTTPTGLGVYIAPDGNYTIPLNGVKVVDKRDTNLDEYGNHNPDFQILNSYRITERTDQVGVLAILFSYDRTTPSQYKWDRSQLSLIIEWDMHNFFAFADQSAKDVDFDNNEEGCGYLYFTGKAMVKGWNKYVSSNFD